MVKRKLPQIVTGSVEEIQSPPPERNWLFHCEYCYQTVWEGDTYYLAERKYKQWGSCFQCCRQCALEGGLIW